MTYNYQRLHFNGFMSLLKKSDTDFIDRKKRKLRKVRPQSEYFPLNEKEESLSYCSQKSLKMKNYNVTCF